MAIQKKHGKGRLDKWYRLAREKGYRARAAFKLIQLNRKYGFLEKSKVLLDLCAAPGSWCQVAAEAMPSNSLIIGVDLAPIRPVPKTITIQSDITSDQCRSAIRSHLKTWKADTVLHDGAPNVGIAWVQDAFSQVELVLQALKLATDFLKPDGTFVTKVFRSKDYNALLWILGQLFDKIEATKPPSSRNVSAEIFVVCRGFKAPQRIDPRILDSRYVFADLKDRTSNDEAKVFNPERKKRKRDGYEEGDHLQYKEALASEFIESENPIAMLASLNRLTFETTKSANITLAALTHLSDTTAEVKICCSDLKVLGRKEFKLLLRWRLRLRGSLGLSSPDHGVRPDSLTNASKLTVGDERLEEDILELDHKMLSRARRMRKRDNEQKRKETARMQLHMIPPTEIGLEQARISGDSSLLPAQFVNNVSRRGEHSNVKEAVVRPIPDSPDSDPEGAQSERPYLDQELDELYNQYKVAKAFGSHSRKARHSQAESDDGEWNGLSSDELTPVQPAETTDCEGTNGSGAVSSLEQRLQHSHLVNKGSSGLGSDAVDFFSREVFKNIQGLESGSEVESAADLDTEAKTSKEEIQSSKSRLDRRPRAFSPQSYCSNDSMHSERLNSDLRSRSQARRNLSTFQSSPVQSREERGPLGTKATSETEINIITAEALTVAQQIASGQKSVHEVIDDNHNKYTYRDHADLPGWFLDDETQHSKLNRPITAAAAAAIKEKLRALNARPIKKIREARSRKKLKLAQHLEKLRKKSVLLADEQGMTEHEKAQSIAKLMSKAGKSRPKRQMKVVVARGGNKGIAGRPRGVKGRYKIVDARLKNDVRAQKRLAKRKA